MALDPHKVQRHDYLLKYTLLPLIPRFVKPNHFTILRLFMTPFVLVLLYYQNFEWGVPLFFIAAITDVIDGSLARLRKQITDWGTFYDPVADKLLIGTVAIMIVAQHINIWMALIIIVLDLLLIIGGIVRKKEGTVTSANTWGKIKMVLQVTGVMALLIAVWLGVDLFIPFSIGTLSLAIVFAVISLFTYGL
jgi:CDP-diacylglycerol---glycerol-3-phosphate 3-phosphatidyltransferase